MKPAPGCSVSDEQSERNGQPRFASDDADLIVRRFHPWANEGDLRRTLARRNILVSQPAALPVQLDEQRPSVPLPRERHFNRTFLGQREIEGLTREQVGKARLSAGVERTENALYLAARMRHDGRCCRSRPRWQRRRRGRLQRCHPAARHCEYEEHSRYAESHRIHGPQGCNSCALRPQRL